MRFDRGDARGTDGWPGVAIIVVNWNGWADTIECLESIFHSDYPNFQVIVCDNDSQDGSLEHVKAWAEGRLDVIVPREHPVRGVSFPPVAKPISYREYDRSAAEAGGDPTDGNASLILIQSGANLGFGGGNNVGLRYMLRHPNFSHAWLLNNDAVVKPDALRHLVCRLKAEPGAGICGSTVVDYSRPDIVQVLGGGKYNKWLGVPWHIGVFRPVGREVDAERVERAMSYVAGVSMLVSLPLLRDVGLLCEDYFLYFEEIDWAIRARNRYELAYAPGSVVYHKGGQSTGTGWDSQSTSVTSDYYHFRARLMVTRKFYPCALPTVYLGLLVGMLRRICRGQWDRVKMIAEIAVRGRSDGPHLTPRKGSGHDGSTG